MLGHVVPVVRTALVATTVTDYEMEGDVRCGTSKAGGWLGLPSGKPAGTLYMALYLALYLALKPGAVFGAFEPVDWCLSGDECAYVI